MDTKIVILPIGSFEQHGPFLPHETDTVICNYIAQRVSDCFENSVLLPSLSYGLSSEHLGIGYTISLKLDSYLVLLSDILNSIEQSITECNLVVLINGHGGNQHIGAAVCSEFNYNHISPKVIIQHVFPDSTRKMAIELFGSFNAHADSVESSVYSAIKGTPNDGIYQIPNFKNGKGLLSLFPVREFSPCGIVSSENNIVINKNNGMRLIDSSVSSICENINNALQKLR